MFYKSIQIGRALAAILVLLFHLGWMIGSTRYSGITGFTVPFKFGNTGVEFFFVLSGFLIYAVHRKDLFRPDRLGNFLYRRFVRLYPIYWIIFFAVLAAELLLPGLSNAVPDGWTLIKSLALVPQAPLIPGRTGAPVLSVAWTLQYEVIFYLLFALLIFNRRLSILAGALLGLNFFLVQFGWADRFPFNFYGSHYMLLFGMGMLVAIWQKREDKRIPFHAFPLPILAIGLLFYLLLSLDTVLGFDLLQNQKIILNGIAFSLILFGLVQAEEVGQLRIDLPALGLLGDASYILYLIHVPMISTFGKIALALGILRPGVLSSALLTFVLIFVACLIASVALHLTLEKPLLNLLRKGSKRPQMVKSEG